MYNRLAVFHAAGLLVGINLGPLLAQIAFHRPDVIITALAGAHSRTSDPSHQYLKNLTLTSPAGTAMIFVSFSAAALVAKRRHFLYLGGILASAISGLCTLRMLNFFMGGTLSAGLFAVELYGGLAMFMCYIIFDTQVCTREASLVPETEKGSESRKRGFYCGARSMLCEPGQMCAALAAVFSAWSVACAQMIIEDAHTGRKDFVAHAMELLLDFVGVFVRLLIILQRNAQRKSEDERRRRR
jgi:FtsH-binding integral membrane protein